MLRAGKAVIEREGSKGGEQGALQDKFASYAPDYRNKQLPTSNRPTAHKPPQVASLQAAIVAAREKARRLKDRTLENEGTFTLSMGNAAVGGSSGTGQPGGGGGGSSGSGGSQVSLKQLGDKVREVYVRCGFDADASISTLQVGGLWGENLGTVYAWGE